MDLFVFPPYMVVVLLQEWISLQELCSLNSSFCNKKFREKFLNIVCTKASLLEGNELSNKMWIVNVESPFRHITLKRCTFCDRTAQFFNTVFFASDQLKFLSMYTDGISLSQFLYPIVKYVDKDNNTYGSCYENSKNTDIGHGTVKFRNGSVYVGALKRDVTNNTWSRDGMGTLTRINGDVYSGSWKEGEFHGEGKYIWKNGQVYTGQFEHDLRCGKGAMVYINGDIYNGEWRNNKLLWGVMNYENGDDYVGGYLAGLRSGQGDLSFPLKNVSFILIFYPYRYHALCEW
jgi:hypothetical protein